MSFDTIIMMVLEKSLLSGLFFYLCVECVKILMGTSSNPATPLTGGRAWIMGGLSATFFFFGVGTFALVIFLVGNPALAIGSPAPQQPPSNTEVIEVSDMPTALPLLNNENGEIEAVETGSKPKEVETDTEDLTIEQVPSETSEAAPAESDESQMQAEELCDEADVQ